MVFQKEVHRSCGDAAVHAAAILRDARATGRLIDALPRSLVPLGAEAALEIQALAATERRGGWKCGLPVDGRLIVAQVAASSIVTAPVRVAVRGTRIRYEPEVAFVLASDLDDCGSPYNRASVVDALAEVRLALELVHGRFRDPDVIDFPSMLADGLFNEGIVIGPVVSLSALGGIDTLTIDGVARDAQHPADDAIAPLVWLANFLVARGTPLKAGEIVITGAYTAPVEVVASGVQCVTFGKLGTIEVDFKFRGDAA